MVILPALPRYRYLRAPHLQARVVVASPSDARLRSLPAVTAEIVIDLVPQACCDYFLAAADLWLRRQVPALIDRSPDAIYKDW